MKELILDTSSKYLYVNFIIDGINKYLVISEGKNNHSDNLLKVIKEGLEKTNIELKDFDRIISGIGPGMYTGLRVSLTVAKMLAWTLNKPLYVFSSLDLLSSGYFKEDSKYLVMMRAKKDYSYTKAFMIQDGKYKLISEEKISNDEEFLKNYDLKEYKIINNDNIKIDYSNIFDLKEIKDIHGLEPNYLREDVI